VRHCVQERISTWLPPLFLHALEAGPCTPDCLLIVHLRIADQVRHCVLIVHLYTGNEWPGQGAECGECVWAYVLANTQ
jgi:hypothetical protein